MGLHVEIKETVVETSESTYIELFKAEIRKEVQFLKDRIIELETKLEDPFG